MYSLEILLVTAISGINPNKEQTKNPSYVEEFRESILGFMERAKQSEKEVRRLQ